MFSQLKWLGWLPSIVQRQNNWNLTPIDFGRPISRQRVIQENGKTLNLCIIKTPASHAPADHPLKTRRFEHLQKRPLLHDFNMKKLESDPNYPITFRVASSRLGIGQATRNVFVQHAGNQGLIGHTLLQGPDLDVAQVT